MRTLRGIISAGNSNGRAWGVLAATAIENNAADGSVVGIEIDVVNEGTDVFVPGLDKEKVGLKVTAFGTHPSTAAIAISGSSLWHKGLWTTQGNFLAISGSNSDAKSTFLELNDGDLNNGPVMLFRV